MIYPVQHGGGDPRTARRAAQDGTTTPRITATPGGWGRAARRSGANDDGEPSGTAGKPILGQLLSNDITDCLVVVVRYFGGTKLGVPGLIAAYRESAAEAIAAARIVERTVDRTIRVDFPYIAMNDIMRVDQGAAA